MNVKRFVACAGLITGGLLGFDVNPAQAVGFQFTSECINEFGEVGLEVCRDQAPKMDVILEQIVYGGEVRSDLTLVNRAEIISNDEHTGGDTGAASADKGDEATLGVVEEGVTATQIANDALDEQSALTNRNLNSIVDTEEQGKFVIDLFFEQAVDNILFWERGKNSALTVQALDGTGQIFGSTVNLGNGGFRRDGVTTKTLEGFTDWYDAGFAIDTTEIDAAQAVGSIGLSKFDFGLADDVLISGLRLTSEGKEFNGPDWKVMGTVDPRFGSGILPESVPEPFAVAGLAVVGGAIVARRRRA
ncbi:MAG: PEP-CTERM sorting domain-containing protein [Cyanothece sp. SIO2G6]|nr:PEP-CTERM sorting domain-containing protein [Cyanothece sp. SIO2G6]